MHPMIRAALERPLRADEAEAAFTHVMTGEATITEMAALLTGLRVRGETAAEVAGGVRALLAARVPVHLEDDRAIDTCGTGGGSLTTFNISTAAAFVAVGAGARVAKHGNRSFTSRCGSADVLEALGIGIDASPEESAAAFRETGFVFMFAPAHHPAVRHIAPVRRDLGVTTVMNLLGPLANPAGVRRQVVGVADPSLLDLLASALAELGHDRALVVHGQPGLDEVSPLGPTAGRLVQGGRVERLHLDPAEFGLAYDDPSDLAGGDARENAERVEAVLRGDLHGVARAAVVLNAAAALWVADVAASLEEGVERAKAAIDTGAASAALERVRSAAPRPADP